MLIWVEDDAGSALEPAAGLRRSMIVVAHGCNDCDEGSFIISYPVFAGDQSQHVPAVTGVLEAMGWSVLASRRQSTGDADFSTALLIATAQAGSEQRLWLAEPVGAADTPAHAPPPEGHPPLPGKTESEIHDQLEAWVTKVAPATTWLHEAAEHPACRG